MQIPVELFYEVSQYMSNCCINEVLVDTEESVEKAFKELPKGYSYGTVTGEDLVTVYGVAVKMSAEKEAHFSIPLSSSYKKIER